MRRRTFDILMATVGQHSPVALSTTAIPAVNPPRINQEREFS